jgi:hypothetical protein
MGEMCADIISTAIEHGDGTTLPQARPIEAAQ